MCSAHWLEKPKDRRMLSRSSLLLTPKEALQKATISPAILFQAYCLQGTLKTNGFPDTEERNIYLLWKRPLCCPPVRWNDSLLHIQVHNCPLLAGTPLGVSFKLPIFEWSPNKGYLLTVVINFIITVIIVTYTTDAYVQKKLGSNIQIQTTNLGTESSEFESILGRSHH